MEERRARREVTSLLATNSWDIVIPKEYIYSHVVDAVRGSIALNASSSPSPALVPYHAIRSSPRTLRIEADEPAASELLGPRSEYEPLPSGGLTEAEARPIVCEVASALAALHSRQVAHGQICSSVETLLRRQRGSDGGSGVVVLGHVLPVALFVPQSPLGRAMRRLAAPEIQRNEPYGRAADVWSLGVLLLQLILPPGKQLETDDVVDTDLLSPYAAGLSSVGQSLLVQCLKGEAEKRPLLAEILVHPFFAVTTAEREGWRSRSNGESGVDTSDGSSSSEGEEEEEEEQEEESPDGSSDEDEDDDEKDVGDGTA